MKKIMWLPLSAVLLYGCGGEEASYDYPDITPNDLSYSYPYNGQQQVAPRAPFIARFSDPVHAFNGESLSQGEIDTLLDTLRSEIASAVVWQRTSDSAPVPFTVELVDNDASENGYSIDAFVLQPTEPLTEAAQYRVDLSGLETDKGTANIANGDIYYIVRGGNGAAKSRSNTQTEFVVTNMVPDGASRPYVDFSTLRMQFSHPLDETTVRYGETVSLLDGDDQLVPAIVYAKGAKLTIDPREDLHPNETYHLEIAADSLRDKYGEALAQSSWDFSPADTTPRELMAQRSGPSSSVEEEQCNKSAVNQILSPITGDSINCVPVKAVLLGDETASQTEGDVFAELAYVPNFAKSTPLRIKRGSLLLGSSVDVRVAGEVPLMVDTDNDGVVDAPLETGDIRVTFISDATGYLFDNPHSTKADEPKHVRLLLDLAMTAEQSQANGAFSQDLLHVEVVGTAIVVDGRLVMDGVGVVEPRVLGLEDAYGVLSFHLESYQNNADAPPPVADTELPFLQSWTPGDHATKHLPGDPIILNFNEPLDVDSLRQSGAFSFTRNGIAAPHSWYFDGSTLVIRPDEDLDFSDDSGAITYGVQVSSLVTDLAGNPLDQDYDVSFALPHFIGTGNRAPIALTAYPGYPCAIADGTMNLAANDHGRCRGSVAVSGRPADDKLPVTTLAANRPISMQFSQNMAPSSFVLGASCGAGTFRVERVDNGGVCQSVVAGTLDVSARELSFTPDEPWQDGVLYRYVALSVGNAFVPSDCGVNAVCSEFNYPLQTVLLEGRAANVGGPDLNIYFRGAAARDDVFQVLRNLPTADVNANYALEAGEPVPLADPDNAGQFITPKNSTALETRAVQGLLDAANLGCGFVGRSPEDGLFIGSVPSKQVCNDKKYVYLTGALNADVVGWNEAEGGIETLIYPNVLMTTSLDTYAVLNLVFAREILKLPTGPQIMRVRYAKDDFGNRTQPVRGYIRPTIDGAVLDITLDVYLDAPELKPTLGSIALTHDLHSFPLQLKLSGPVTLLPDGRMEISQLNAEASANIDVDIALAGIGAAGMSLGIPLGGINLNYLGAPLKK